MSTCHLRLALLSDSAAIAALFIRARAEAMPWLPSLYGETEILRWVQKFVSEEHTTVAIDDGEVAGFLTMQGIEILHLYVDPRHQERGIGSALLLRSKGANAELSLWTFTRNVPARRFYERHGFSEVDATDGENEEREPDIKYHWTRT